MARLYKVLNHLALMAPAAAPFWVQSMSHDAHLVFAQLEQVRFVALRLHSAAVQAACCASGDVVRKHLTAPSCCCQLDGCAAQLHCPVVIAGR